MIYISSDLHLGHANILKFEPNRVKVLGDTIERHDIGLINRFNEKLQPDDTLIIVGDFGFDHQSRLTDYLSRFKCRNKILVIGNHDKHTIAMYYKIGFNCVTYELMLKLAGEMVRVRHHPYRRPWYKVLFRGREKDRNKRPINMGNFLLHGHLHHGTDPKWASKVQRIYERQINIGVDFNNYYPVALDKLASDIVKIREGKV